MIGLHPTSVGADYEKELEIVARELASPNEFVAVGEIGMDLYWDKTFSENSKGGWTGRLSGLWNTVCR